MADTTQKTSGGVVPWLALCVSVVALVFSGGSLYVAYTQSPLSGRFAPKLSFGQYTVVYRVEGEPQLRAMCVANVRNDGEGPARDIYFELRHLTKGSPATIDGVDHKIVQNEDGSRLYHVPLLPKKFDFGFGCEPGILPESDVFPHIALIHSPAGPIPADEELQQEIMTRFRNEVETNGLPDFHGDKRIEIVQEYTAPPPIVPVE